MRLREYLVTLIDRFCFWYCSVITGRHIDIPPRCQATAGPYREFENCAPIRLANTDLPFESYRDDTTRSHGTWPNRIDFAGTVALYLLVKDAFEREGLPYRPGYRGAGGDSFSGNGDVTRQA